MESILKQNLEIKKDQKEHQVSLDQKYSFPLRWLDKLSILFQKLFKLNSRKYKNHYFTHFLSQYFLLLKSFKN